MFTSSMNALCLCVAVPLPLLHLSCLCPVVIISLFPRMLLCCFVFSLFFFSS